ncbi:hypothetical protein JY409_04490 [Stenotrophomonas maltophilia]|nr:hypothetical protein [Stenotrophomonas maltophilia]
MKALDDLAAYCSDDTATVDRHVAVIRAALAARQPVRHVRLPQSDLDLINEAAARQPVGQEPFGWLIYGHAGGPMFCPASHRHIMEANATDLSKEIGIAITEVYAAPPAREVDLAMPIAGGGPGHAYRDDRPGAGSPLNGAG